MRKNNSFILIAILSFLFLTSITFYNYQQKHKKSERLILNIDIPCGLTLPFKELAAAYESAYRSTKVKTVSDSSNVLTKFVINRDNRPELFVSSGKQEIGILMRKGLIEEESIRPFGRYELILVVPKNSQIKELAGLLNDSVRKIDIANQDFNSIGVYAIQSLRSLGYWDKLQMDKFVLFTNTSLESLSFVATGKADATVHYNICPFRTSSDKVTEGSVKIVTQLPSDSHEPIQSYIGILKDSKNKEEAKRFINFMFSKKGNKILNRYGLGEDTLNKTKNSGFWQIKQ